MKLTMIRKTNDTNIRFYKLAIELNLFNEYLVERIYGSVKNKSPTGMVKNIFKMECEAMSFARDIVSKKLKKGYQIKEGGQDV
jgi:predicted DNA-binding WGR domain protein